jgi:hypothetical protein
MTETLNVRLPQNVPKGYSDELNRMLRDPQVAHMMAQLAQASGMDQAAIVTSVEDEGKVSLSEDGPTLTFNLGTEGDMDDPMTWMYMTMALKAFIYSFFAESGDEDD